MKYILSIFLGSCLLVKANSQVYHPIPYDAMWWVEVDLDEPDYWYHTCVYITDRQIFPDHFEVHNGNTYIALKCYYHLEINCYSGGPGYLAGIQDYALLRNDSLNHKVYCYDTTSNEEKILYDFDLVLGDTIQNPGGLFSCTEIWTVIGIDSLDIGGGDLRKRYTVRRIIGAGSQTAHIIEGIGSDITLAKWGICGLATGVNYLKSSKLSCFHEPNHDYAPSTTSWYYDYCIAPIGIEPIKPLSNFLQPLGQNQWLVTTNEIELLNLSCYDIMGHQLFTKDYYEKDIVDLNDLSSGIYILHANIQGKPCRPLKIMVQH